MEQIEDFYIQPLQPESNHCLVHLKHSSHSHVNRKTKIDSGDLVKIILELKRAKVYVDLIQAKLITLKHKVIWDIFSYKKTYYVTKFLEETQKITNNKRNNFTYNKSIEKNVEKKKLRRKKRQRCEV